ncbi:MAG TPA: FCD domain-containing protein [Acidimicrobiales bacterium]|jgi:DNA-binding FadR family transcriptional regulator|nr:FCD domain-containing protein [Acidimicrobiales bacterium]
MTRVGTRGTKGREKAAAAQKSASAAGGADSRIVVDASGGIFRPLKTAERVARDIVHDMLADGLGTGDSLPPEAAMMEHYGVSRESLREGLRLLETQGLIVIKRGPRGGPIVGSVDPGNLGRVATLYFHMAGATYNDLFDAWVEAESLLAERAARNPDPDERAAAMAAYLEDRPDDPEELEEFVTSHTDFHGRMAKLVRNNVLALTYRSYGMIVSHHVAIVDDPRHLGSVLAEDHRAVAKAIISGHPNSARRAMEAHISHVIDDARKQLGERVDDLVEWL